MSIILPSNLTLIQAMQKVGLLPDECVSMQILTEEFDAPVQIRYVVNVKAEQVPLIAEAYRIWGQHVQDEHAAHRDRVESAAHKISQAMSEARSSAEKYLGPQAAWEK